MNHEVTKNARKTLSAPSRPSNLRGSFRFAAVASTRATAAFLLFSLALAGCNTSGIQPVDGLVTWRDGTPAKELAGSLIFFEQPEKQMSARGQITADGTFQLTTINENDGAPLGEHVVLIIEVGRKPAGGPDATLLAPGKIDSRYLSHGTSDLRAEVKPGRNKITLAVDRAAR